MKEEGFFKLWQGMSPAIYRHVVYSGVRMTFYEYIRDDIIGKNRVEESLQSNYLEYKIPGISLP